jgi:hypothetical protein
VDNPICRRALAYIESIRLVNPRILTVLPARPELVTQFGTPGSAEYGEVLIEADEPESVKARMLSESPPEALHIWRAIADAGIRLRITCSGENVIHVEIPGVDLD